MNNAATSTSEGARPTPHPEVEWAYLGPTAMVFDPRSNTVAHLNEAAGSIWVLLDGTRTVEDVVSELSQAYEVPAAQMRADVDAAVADFTRRGLLAQTP